MAVEGVSGICVSDVTKIYGTTRVLDGVSFDCPPGSVTGLVGPNGSGKSTTMRVMVGLTRPDAGSVTFGGQAYVALPDPGRAVGTVLDPQAHHPGRSVDETLAIAAILMGVRLADSRRLRDRLGLGNVGRRRFGALSLGMRQRVALAVALLGEPRFLILDEPMNGLDIETSSWVRDTLVNHAHSTGGAVLVSTHLLAELQTFADRIVVLSEGRVSHSGSLGHASDEQESFVVPADAQLMRRALDDRGIRYTIESASGRFRVGARPRVLSSICVAEHLLVDELGVARESIEDAYRRATRGEFRVMKETS